MTLVTIVRPDVAICGLAHIDSSRVADSVALQTFLANGAYNATEWITGDLISAQRMNKLEDGLFWNNYYAKLSVDTYDQLADIDVIYIAEGTHFAYVKNEDKFYYYTEEKQWQELKTGGADVTTLLKDYAKTSDIPTKVSQLINDKGYLVSIPEQYATKQYVDSEIKEQLGDLDIDIDLTEYATKDELPTRTSQLTNDSGYLTSIPDEYVTETELSTKGYLTEHQDISNKVDKVDGKGLSTNDYTTNEKNKLAGIENGANNITVWLAAQCTTFTSDDVHSTCTPAAVKKAVGMFEPKSHEHSEYTQRSELPITVSKLIDDRGFATREYVDEITTIDYETYLSFNTGEIIGGSSESYCYFDTENNLAISSLSSGTYSLKYKYEDGTFSDVADFTV